MSSLAALSLLFLQSPIVVPAADHLIDPTHVPTPGRYLSTGVDGHAVWVVKASGVSIDLTSRFLLGNQTTGTNQDAYKGIGLLLDGCKNVTVKNANVQGFRFNVVLRNCTNVRLLTTNADHSRAIRMGQAGKPVDTFLNLRDLASWRTYGAGIWLEKCEGCRVEGCTATQAQNGIALIDTNNSNIVDNHCSYNGGWGLAIWNGQRNTLAWNHADFCNRPWSGGWGGDAAGIVVVNSACSNQFVANSLTHSGDGFFLTDKLNGGFDTKTQKYTLDSGSNTNYVAHNDGSWSSNNAFEGTFSEGNVFYANQADDSNYGFWLGFSNHSFVYQNEIQRNHSDGVAIGQGSDNNIANNQIADNHEVAVHIWSDPGPAETARPSSDNHVSQNQIRGSRLGLSLERSFNPLVQDNSFQNAPIPPGIQSTGLPLVDRLRLRSWKSSNTAKRLDALFAARPKGWLFYRDTNGPKGEAAIKVGDFAPDRS